MERARVVGLLWIAVGGIAMAVGCASGEPDEQRTEPGCEQDRDCARGQVCADGTCRRPERDGSAPAPDVGRRDAAPPRDEGVADMGDADVDAAADADGAAADAALDATPDAEAPCMPGTIRDCGRSVGICRAGTQTCDDDGAWGACQGSIDPQPEICNRADDDCNGVVDDGFDIGSPCDGIGACGMGTIECRNQVQTRCSTEPGGSRAEDRPEICNGVDDDCDGRTDEGLGVGDACVGFCGPGTRECGPGNMVVCSTDAGGSESEPRPEQCNQRDDDCDQRIDEGFPLGEPCDGVGACGAGVHECGPAGLICSTDPEGTAPQVRPEVCNGVDDDCDGQTDEGFAVGGACVGVGACGEGVLECSPQGQIRCSTDPGGSQSRATPERCNRADDDCDGRTDEGLGLGNACPAQGVCAAGTLECGPGESVVCSTRPGGSANQGGAEACNGRDDDCDGSTDEDFEVGRPCMGRGACGAGVGECDAQGRGVCSTEPGGSASQATPEACDGADNDCDGRVDEGDACGGDTCLAAPLVDLSTPREGDTRALADDYQRATCLGGGIVGPDQSFRFDVPAAGDYAVGVAPLDPAFDLLFWVASACNGLENCLVANAGRDAQGAGRPEARVIPFPRGGTFFLTVDSRIEQHGGRFIATVRALGDGERCGNAIPLPLPGRFVSTTELRTGDVAASQCPAGAQTLGPDMVFRVDLPAPRRVRATVTPATGVDVVIYAIGNCGDPDNSCIGGANAAGAGGVERLDQQLPAGTTYLVVDHLGAPGGAFLIEVEAP